MDIFLYAYSGFCHKSDKSNERKDVFDFVGIFVCVCGVIGFLSFLTLTINVSCDDCVYVHFQSR